MVSLNASESKCVQRSSTCQYVTDIITVFQFPDRDMVLQKYYVGGGHFGVFTWISKKPHDIIIIINPILIQVYFHKRGLPDLLHSNSNLSNAHSPSCSIQGILLLQTNTLALLLYLCLPCLLWSSSLPFVLHFKKNG